jgi:hypothetical protein
MNLPTRSECRLSRIAEDVRLDPTVDRLRGSELSSPLPPLTPLHSERAVTEMLSMSKDTSPGHASNVGPQIRFLFWEE